MPREIIRADFEAIYKQYAEKAVKRFNLTGKHPPQLYAVKLGKEAGSIEKSGSLNKVAPMFFDGAMPKDGMRQLLQELTTPGSVVRKMAASFGAVVPDIVVQINEVWITKIDKKGISQEERERLENMAPSENPDREECVMIALHTYQYSTMGLCPIRDKPKRHAEMAPLGPENGKMTGRMSMTTFKSSNPEFYE